MNTPVQLNRKDETDMIFAVRCRKEGAAEGLLQMYKPLMSGMARRIAGYRAHDWENDLIQAGSIGILRAAERFDPAQGVCFATYAVPWMLGEMKRTMRAEFDHAGDYEPRRKLLAAKDLLSSQLGRMPTLGELSENTGIDLYETALLLELTSLTIGFDEYSTQGKEIPAKNGGIDLDALNLHSALEKLGEAEQRLIRLRYFEDRTQCETANALGMSQSAVSKAEKKALLHLRALLFQDRITAASTQRAQRIKE